MKASVKMIERYENDLLGDVVKYEYVTESGEKGINVVKAEEFFKIFNTLLKEN